MNRSSLGPRLLAAVLVGVVALGAQAAGRANASPPRAPRTAVDTATVPRGWLPFSFGYIQMAVRPTWDLWYSQSVPLDCPTGFSGPVLLIYTSPSPDNPPRPDCAGGRPSDTTVLVWYPATLKNAKALRHQQINGIAVDGPKVVGKWQEMSLPKLGIVIYTEGPRALAVLRTLSYSARAALSKLVPAPAVPPDWGWLIGDGLQFAVPSSWAIDHRAGRLPQLDSDSPLWLLASTVLFYSGGQPSFVGGNEVSEGGTALGLADDLFDQEGVVLSSPPLTFYGTAYITGPVSEPCALIHTLKICLSPGDNTLYGPALYTIRRPGSRKVVTLTVGLAGDGLVARTIIGSFRPA
jgi:hypothetical protein